MARVSIVQEPLKQQEESVFQGVVADNSEQWTIPLRLNDQQMNFCIDTGTEVTVIPEKVYFCIGRPALKPLDKNLKGAGAIIGLTVGVNS